MRPTFLVVLSCVGAGTFISRLDAYIVSVALPSMGEAFGRDMASMSGVMLFYLLAVASSMLVVGSLGDRFGLRRIILSGYFLFSLMSLVCSLLNGLDLLEIARFLQGLGAALLLVSGYSLVTKFVATNRVGSAVGIMNMVGSLGVLLGAPLGGVLTQWLGWPSIFWVNVPLGFAAMFLCWRRLPPDELNCAVQAPFDWLGALLSMAGLWGVLLGLDSLGNEDPLLASLAWIVVGVACLAVFVWHERRIADPLIDMSLFSNAVFRYALLAKIFAFVQMSAHSYVMPFYLDWTRGYTTQGTGAALAVFPIIMSLAAPLAGRLADREGDCLPPPAMTTLAMSCGALACLFFAVTLTLDADWPTFVFLVFSGLSYGFFLSPNGRLILTNVPEQSRAVGASIFTSSTNVGMALGVPVAVILFHLAGGADLTAHDVDNLSGFRFVYMANAVCGLIAAGFAFASLRAFQRQRRAERRS